MRPQPFRPVLFALSLVAPAAAQSAADAFDHDLQPAFRGTASAAYAGWTSFSVPFGGTNAPDDPASDLAATVEQLRPGALITSTMNLYAPGVALELELDVQAGAPLREAVVQVRSLGTPLALGSFRLRYDGGGAPVELAPTSSLTLNPAPGFAEERAITFDVSGLGIAITDFSVVLEAAGANTSLDALMIDVRTQASVGVTYCSAVPNSTGAVGDLAALGSIRIVDADLALRATSLPPNSFGMYVASRTQGFAPLSGGVGTLCLGGSIGRYTLEVFDSGALGANTTTLDVGALRTATGFTAAAPGETWNFQCWHRDFAPGVTSNFTLPVSVTFE